MAAGAAVGSLVGSLASNQGGGGGGMLNWSDILTGGMGSVAGPMYSLFGPKSPAEKMQEYNYGMLQWMGPDATRQLIQAMKGAGYIDYKTGETVQEAFLPPALQRSVQAMRRMTDIETVGGIDELTRTGIEGLDQLAEMLAERGDITGGQRTAMTQGLRDRILSAMLQTRRAGASTAAGYEADVWKGLYGTAMEAAGISTGFNAPVTSPGYLQNLTQGSALASGLTDFASGLYGLFNQPDETTTGEPVATTQSFWQTGNFNPHGTWT